MAKINAPSVEAIRGQIPKRGSFKDFRFDEFGYFRKSKKTPCAWQEKDKPFPKGRTELDIVSNEAAEELGVRPGPALRLCYEKNRPAPIISVDDPYTAQEIAADFRDCVVNGEGDTRSCAARTLERKRPGQPIKIAGFDYDSKDKEYVRRLREAFAGKKPKSKPASKKRGVRAPKRKPSKSGRKSSKR